MNIWPIIMWNGKFCPRLWVKYMGAHCVHVSISRRSTHGICYMDSVDSPQEAWMGGTVIHAVDGYHVGGGTQMLTE